MSPAEPIFAKPKPELVVVECDEYHVSQRDGRFVLELVGAVATPLLPPHRNYLTPAQVAKRLQIGTRTLRKMMAHKTNPIPFVRVGKAPRFVESEITDWSARGRTVAARRTAAKIDPTSLFGGRARK